MNLLSFSFFWVKFTIPFPMKIQPIDIDSQAPMDPIVRADATKPILKLQLKRLIDQQLT
jgi:hypothetical protein